MQAEMMIVSRRSRAGGGGERGLCRMSDGPIPAFGEAVQRPFAPSPGVWARPFRLSRHGELTMTFIIAAMAAARISTFSITRGSIRSFLPDDAAFFPFLFQDYAIGGPTLTCTTSVALRSRTFQRLHARLNG